MFCNIPSAVRLTVHNLNQSAPIGEQVAPETRYFVDALFVHGCYNPPRCVVPVSLQETGFFTALVFYSNQVDNVRTDKDQGRSEYELTGVGERVRELREARG